MDRGRRAEPYSNATIWTREIARNLAGHLSRVSKAHSCVDTRSPKSTRLPQFHHSHAQKRCPTSPMKTRQPLMKISRNPNLNGDQELEFRGLSVREETDGAGSSNHTPEVDSMQSCKGKQEFITGPNNGTPQFENHTTSSSLAANQEVSDRSVRIPAVKPPPRQHIRSGNGNSIDATYDAPLVLPQQKQRLAHDYYKRQEQQKIWQENQALIKRLQSTKGTLNFKQWEKDGKWTQEFVRNQEKRRTALQQELRRAQASPQAVLRSKPLKSFHPHHLISLDSRGNCDATVRLASAANHRPITKLRKKKTSPPSSAYAVESPSTELDFGTSCEQAAFIPDNEIVAVRFTFSRGRSRGADTNTRDLEQLEQPGSLEVDESDRDMMSLSGAFSPGAELECALNAAAVNDSASFEQPQQSQPPETGTADDGSVEANESYQSDADFHSNNSEETVGGLLDDVCAVQDEVVVDFETNDGQIVTAEGGDSSTEVEKGIRTVPNETVVAADVQDENKEQPLEAVENTVHYAPESGFETTCRDLPIETDERKSTPLPEAEHVHSEEEEEEYGGDNFDDGHLSSVRAAEGQHNKLEASYASEFEEEPFYGFYNNVPDAVPADNQANALNAIPTDNQDEDDEEEEYSHDDFE